MSKDKILIGCLVEEHWLTLSKRLRPVPSNRNGYSATCVKACYPMQKASPGIGAFPPRPCCALGGCATWSEISTPYRNWRR